MWLGLKSIRGAQMTHSAQKRTNIAGFIATVALSAVTMLWLFWHHPVSTAIATVVVLAGLGISARLAHFIQNDNRGDMSRGKQGV